MKTRVAQSIAVALALGLVLTAGLTARAEAPAVLKVIPDDALAVIVMPRLDRADAAGSKLAQTVAGQKVSLLDQFSNEFGAREAIDEKGSWALAVLPGEQENAAPQFLMFMPVTDYKKFLAPLKPADDTADVTAVQMRFGQKAYAAHKGNFAIFAEPSTKSPEALLKKVVASTKSVDAALAPLADWSSAHDVAAVATPAGVKKGVTAAKQVMQLARMAAGQLGGDQGAMVKNAFDMYDNMFAAIEKNVTVAGIAGRMDQNGAGYIDSRVVYTGGDSSKPWVEAGTPGAGLASLPAGPFMVAFEGAFPQAMMKNLAPLTMQAFQMGAKNGGKQLTPEQQKKLTSALENSWVGVKSMSMTMATPKVGESLYAGTVAVMKVEDSQAFLASYQKTLDVFAEIGKDVNSSLFPLMQSEKTTVNGKPGLVLTVDLSNVLKAAGNAPGSEETMKMIVGPSGKLKTYVQAVDAKTVALSYVTPDSIKAVADTLQNPGGSLMADADVKQTLSILPRSAQWTLLLSPRGIADFTMAIVLRNMPQGGPQPPRFPQTPPIGVAVEGSSAKLDVAIVVPAPTLKAFGTYMQSLMMRPAAGPAQPAQPQFQ